MENGENTHAFLEGLVSIIVPVYNCEKYLRLCIDSVIDQSYKNIELILIDDGSTDGSGEICDAYALRDDRISVIHKKNSGPAAARNAGIENSRGSFLFFVDADDFIEKNAISSLMENYGWRKADIIIGDFRKIKEDDISDSGHNRVFSDSKLLTKEDIIAYTRYYLGKPNRFPLFAYSWGRLFKSSIVKTNKILFNTSLHTFEDVAFNFDYLNYANEIFFLKETIYDHLVHDNYASATMTIGNDPRKMFGFRQALGNIGDFLDNCKCNAEIRKEVGHAYVCLTIIQLVRICGQINSGNERMIYELIGETINDSNLRDNLQFYSPTQGDSRILPILMKLRLVWPIILVCKYKANKRYRKRGAGR